MRNRIISCLVLCYNERHHIVDCANAVLKFHLPDGFEKEILIIDGMSNDGTRDLLRSIVEKNPSIRVVDNPKRITPCAMNTGIKNSRGEFIAILSAHATYPPDYLLRCLETSERTGADNVGGIFLTQQNGDQYSAALVQALTTHVFGVGSSYRTNKPEGPADTVAYGFYRRSVFERIGFFDERLIRAQDYELNRRLTISGGTIWLNPEIKVLYKNQKSVWRFYAKQLFKEAPYNAYLWYLAPYAFAPRHAITGVFAAGVIGGTALSPFLWWIRWPFLLVMCLYAVLAIFSGIQQTVRYRKLRHAVVLPFCFFLYHFIHGVGLLGGLLALGMRVAPVQKGAEPWPGAARKRAWPVRPASVTN